MRGSLENWEILLALDLESNINLSSPNHPLLLTLFVSQTCEI